MGGSKTRRPSTIDLSFGPAVSLRVVSRASRFNPSKAAETGTVYLLHPHDVTHLFTQLTLTLALTIPGLESEFVLAGRSA